MTPSDYTWQTCTAGLVFYDTEKDEDDIDLLIYLDDNLSRYSYDNGEWGVVNTVHWGDEQSMSDYWPYVTRVPKEIL